MKIDDLVKLLHLQNTIDAPDTGHSSVVVFKEQSQLWPSETYQVIEPVYTAEDTFLIFAEFRFVSRSIADPVLPVLFVFDKRANSARVYSDVALALERPSQLGRTSISSHYPDNELVQFLSAMKENRLDDVVDFFSPNGSFTHSNDMTLVGADALRLEFSNMMGATGLPMEILTMVSGSQAIAAECLLPNGRINAGVYCREASGEFINVRTYM